MTAGPKQMHRAKLSTIEAVTWNVGNVKTRRPPRPW